MQHGIGAKFTVKSVHPGNLNPSGIVIGTNYTIMIGQKKKISIVTEFNQLAGADLKLGNNVLKIAPNKSHIGLATICNEMAFLLMCNVMQRT